MTNTDETATSSINAISADAVSSLFQAISGLRNLRAAATMLACFALSVLIPGLLWMLLGKGIYGMSIGMLVYIFLVAIGINAGGLLLMDQAKQVQMVTITDAIILGIWCAIKSIILIIVLVLIVIVIYLLMALLFFVCKIPGVGPLVYAIVFPISVVIMGLTFIGLLMGMMLAMAAVWEGSTVAGALVKALVVLRTRLVETVLMTLVVFFLAGFVFSIVSGVMMMGFLPAVGMSASILGASPQMFGSLGASLMGMGGGDGGGYLLAGSFGGGLLFALMMTLVLQVWLLGINMVFLRATEGLDTSETEKALQSGLAEARRKAVEIGSKAKQAAENARAHATQTAERTRTESVEAPNATVQARASEQTIANSAQSEAGQTLTTAFACPICSAEVSPNDHFCGACGQRMKAK